MTNKKKSVKKEYKNTPPKEIMNAIWGHCFDYKDFDKKVMNEKIRDRIYDSWQTIHFIIKDWIKIDEKDFLEYIKKNNPEI